MSDCIFCKIAQGEIPSKKLYEDGDLVAFHDINPAAPVHFLIVPKEHIASLEDAHARHEMLLGRILLLAPMLAKEQGLTDGFKTVINTGKGGGQVVFHLHVHVLGGGKLAHV
ncbi:MAG: histidine triad nucleotide-binding protein [Sulfuricellaceae bacterium]|jgi:histidine triad (HIT) family protein